jgi:ABC-type lipoprotein export system ATPase subunit
MELFKRLNDEGATIIQVTHSEQNASFGNRVVRLEDGWIADSDAASAVEQARATG